MSIVALILILSATAFLGFVEGKKRGRKEVLEEILYERTRRRNRIKIGDVDADLLRGWESRNDDHRTDSIKFMVEF